MKLNRRKVQFTNKRFDNFYTTNCTTVTKGIGNDTKSKDRKNKLIKTTKGVKTISIDRPISDTGEKADVGSYIISINKM